VTNRVSRERHWFPAHQPQTLQIAALLLYWNAFLGLVAGLAVGEAAGAFGIADGRRWGYVLVLAAAVVPLVLVIAVAGFLGAGTRGLLLQVTLVVLLVHPTSRDDYRLWYR